MEARLFAVITSLLVFETLATAQVAQSDNDAMDARVRCEQISQYMGLVERKRFIYEELDKNFAAYEELEPQLPAETNKVLGAHRFFALMRSETLPDDLTNKVHAWQVSIDRSLQKLDRRLGDETMDLVWRAYQLRQERSDLVEALAKIHREQAGGGLASIRSIEAQMESRGVDFFAFDPAQPQPCW